MSQTPVVQNCAGEETATELAAVELHPVERSKKPPVVKKYSDGSIAVPLQGGLNPASLSEFSGCQNKLMNEYKELNGVYNTFETQFNKLNNKAVQLEKVLRQLELTYAKLNLRLNADQDAYCICTDVAENEAKMKGLIDLNKQVQDSYDAMNKAGNAMNIVVDECNRVAKLMNAAGEAVNAVAELIL